MATIPFALSVSHLVSSAGADVGFAAIAGLAILVLLFFSQARETAMLRRRADEAEEQLHQLAAYVDQLARRPVPQPSAPQTVAPAPAPAAARMAGRPAPAPAVAAAAAPAASRPVPAAAAAGAAAMTIPAAPAGVGAPALSAATRLVPLGAADEISIRSLKNGHVDSEPAPVAEPEPAGPPPSTAAGGSNGVARAPAPVPAPAGTATAVAGPPPATGERALPRRDAVPGGRPPGSPPGRPAPPPEFRDPVPPSRRRLSRFGILAAAIVAAVVIVAVVLVVNGGGGTASHSNASSPSSAAARSSKRTSHASATHVVPSAVTVAVLNGTSTYHLAADIMSKLTAAGYKPGAKANAPTQTLTTTTVGYTKPSFRADALAVAKSLNLGSASVQGLAQSDRTAACGGAATCPAEVVVTAGSDLASVASGSSSG